MNDEEKTRQKMTAFAQNFPTTSDACGVTPGMPWSWRHGATAPARMASGSPLSFIWKASRGQALFCSP